MKQLILFALVCSILVCCGIFKNGENNQAKAEFVFQKSQKQSEFPDFDVVYNDNGNSVLHRDQFSKKNNRLEAGPFSTKKSGSLSVRVNLLKNKIPQSSGEVSLPLKEDWKYRIIFRIGSGDPTEGCFGCTGYKSFAIDSSFKSSPDDSLYIVWGGNSINDPVQH